LYSNERRWTKPQLQEASPNKLQARAASSKWFAPTAVQIIARYGEGRIPKDDEKQPVPQGFVHGEKHLAVYLDHHAPSFLPHGGQRSSS
jgi:hypothetical protein